MPIKYDFTEENFQKDQAKKTDPPGPLSTTFVPNVVENILDIQKARVRFEKLLQLVDKMADEMAEVVVVGEMSAEAVVALCGDAKSLIDKIETTRKSIIEKPDKFVRKVNAIAKTGRDKLSKIDQIGRRKIADFEHERELERRAAEKKMREENEKKQAVIDAKAEQMGVDSVKLPDMKAPRKPDPIRTDSGSASSRMVWTYEVETVDLLPREYLTIDHKAIKQAIKAGIRQIDGVRIYEETKVTIRRS